MVGDPNSPTNKSCPASARCSTAIPSNNFLKRALAFNPDGVLTARAASPSPAHYAYILCDRGLVVVDLDNPTKPAVTAEIGAPVLERAAGHRASSSATPSWSTARA